MANEAKSKWDEALPVHEFANSFDIRFNSDTPDKDKIRVNVVYVADGVTARQLVPIAARSRNITVANGLRGNSDSAKQFADKCAAMDGRKIPLIPSGIGIAIQTVGEAERVIFAAVKEKRLTLENCAPSMLVLVEVYTDMVAKGEEL